MTKKLITELEAQISTLKTIAVYERAIANFSGSEEGQDYHVNFILWDIDRDSYLAEALNQLKAEHPGIFDE